MIGLKQSAKLLLDLLFPIECLGCGQEGVWFCQDCLAALPFFPERHCPFCGEKNSWGETCKTCRARHALDGAITFIPYANPVIQKLIHAWKYQSAKDLSTPLAQFVSLGLETIFAKLQEQSRVLQRGLGRAELIAFPIMPTLLLSRETTLLPVPLAPKRLRSRGFNQAEELAKGLAQSRGYNLDCLVQRTRHTAPQATLTGSDRLTNIKKAFAISANAESVVGKNFLIIDDVITTGSTCDSLARLLKENQAASVWALAVAFGHPL